MQISIASAASPASDALHASSVVTYLLEKGSVSSHAPGEQTFHAFYGLVAAAAAAGEVTGTARNGITRRPDRAAVAGHPTALPWLVHAANSTPLRLRHPHGDAPDPRAAPRGLGGGDAGW